MERVDTANYDWQIDAACVGEDPAIFDTEFSNYTNKLRAKQICGGCAVRAACLDSAIENHEVGMIWGGLTDEERRVRRSEYLPVLTKLANDPTQLERADLVLPQNGRTLLRRLLYGSTDTPDTLPRPEMIGVHAHAIHREIGNNSNRRKLYLKDRQRVVRTSEALLDGSFDYRQWAYTPGKTCARSALLFLARMEAPIPRDADLEELKSLAMAHINVLRPTDDQVRAAIVAYYGLNSDEPSSKDQIAKELSVSPADLERKISSVFMHYRQRRAA